MAFLGLGAAGGAGAGAGASAAAGAGASAGAGAGASAAAGAGAGAGAGAAAGAGGAAAGSSMAGLAAKVGAANAAGSLPAGIGPAAIGAPAGTFGLGATKLPAAAAQGGGMLEGAKGVMSQVQGMTDMLTKAIQPGGVSRKVGETFKGSPIGDFATKFGNSYDPMTGEFRPDALFNKDTNDWLKLQRGNMEKISSGEPGKRPVDTMVEILTRVLGAPKKK